VVALEVVLEEELPVGPHLVRLAERQREAIGPGGEHVRSDEVEGRVEWCGRAVTECDEDEPVPRLDVARDEAPLRVVDELAVGRSGHVAQAAVGAVAPAVVRTGEAGGVALRLLAEAVARECRQMLKNARTSAAASRTTMMLSPAISSTRKSPGPGSCDSWATNVHCRKNTRSTSVSNVAGER
jgi:hypothetical protein